MSADLPTTAEIIRNEVVAFALDLLRRIEDIASDPNRDQDDLLDEIQTIREEVTA